MQLDTDRIRYEMDRQGLTIQSLADRMGIRRHGVYYYLKDRHNLKMESVRKLAKALEVTPKDLLK